MSTVDLDHLRYKLCGVLPALQRMKEHIVAAPPTVIAACIIIGHTTREQVEALLGKPWRPRNDASRGVAHYVYDARGGGTLASLFLEYDGAGVVRALSARSEPDAVAQ